MNKNSIALSIALFFSFVGNLFAQNFSTLDSALQRSYTLPGSFIVEKCSTYYEVLVPAVGDTAKKPLSRPINIRKSVSLADTAMVAKGVFTISNMTSLGVQPERKVANEVIKNPKTTPNLRFFIGIIANRDTVLGSEMPTGVEFFKLSETEVCIIYPKGYTTKDSASVVASSIRGSFVFMGINRPNYTEDVKGYRLRICTTYNKPATKLLTTAISAVNINDRWYWCEKTIYKSAQDAQPYLSIYGATETYNGAYIVETTVMR